MIETKEENRRGVFNRKVKYVPDAIVEKSAIKKEAIVTMITEGSQLTLLGTLVEQIGDKVGLDTPEFTQAKAIFNGIRNELNK